MLALEKEDFIAVLRSSLETLGKRFGFINANLRLIGVDSSAIDLMLYEASREVCAYRRGRAAADRLLRRGRAGVRVCSPGADRGSS